MERANTCWTARATKVVVALVLEPVSKMLLHGDVIAGLAGRHHERHFQELAHILRAIETTLQAGVASGRYDRIFGTWRVSADPAGSIPPSAPRTGEGLKQLTRRP
jgi:hypothetical protein